MRISLLQVIVENDKIANIQTVGEFIRAAKQRGAEVIVLPECFNCPYGLEYFQQFAEIIPNGPTSQTLSLLASSNRVWIIAGSMPEKDGGKFYNTCAVFNPQGKLHGKYRKIHLFDVDIPDKITFKESEVMTSGDKLLTVEINDFKIGLGICYDIRFPEIAAAYSQQGCNLLIYPSVFNTITGPVYWKILQQARAVDTQSYVVTCSCAKSPSTDYPIYGHSMVIGPDGQVLGEINGDQEEIMIVDLDVKYVNEVRASLPVLTQKRSDLFKFTVIDPSEAPSA